MAVALLCDRRLLVAHAESLEVAHEALFTGWPRLAAWLADAASSRRELDRVAVAAGDWAHEGRDDAQLLRGPRLLAATELVQAHPQDVAALEREYVEASSVASQRATEAERVQTTALVRSRRRTRVFAAALAVALLVSISAGGVAVRQARNAGAAALAADAGRVGALAKDQSLPEDRALLLAVQADALQAASAQDSSLVAALSRSSALRAAARSPSRVLSVSVSPDGSRVVTAGVQGQIVTWDPRTLRPVSTLTGDPAAVVVAAPGGRTVVGRQGVHPAVQVFEPGGRLVLSVDLPPNDFAPQVAGTGSWFTFVSASGPTSDTVQLRSIDAPSDVVASTTVPGHVAGLAACGPARFCVMIDSGQPATARRPSGHPRATRRHHLWNER